MNLVTAGESHGKGLFAIIEGIPAGLKLDLEKINSELKRRQSGFGRGERQKIERDCVELLAGVRNFTTLGSPIALAIWNSDFQNWKPCMAPEECDPDLKSNSVPRPGHADLPGMLKFQTLNARDISERASARESAIRVAAGTICRQLLEELDVSITGYVRAVGRVCDKNEYTFTKILLQRSPRLGMMDPKTEQEAVALVEEAQGRGETLGGVLELRIHGLKGGFGSCMTYAQKLDSRLLGAVTSVQAIKGAEIGAGFSSALLFGSEAQDEIFLNQNGLSRKSNRAGGIEGGISNGEEIVLRAAMKPLPSVRKGLASVDLRSGQPASSAYERSDVCAVLACETVLEAAVAVELCKVVLEQLGGDTLAQVRERYGRLPQ